MFQFTGFPSARYVFAHGWRRFPPPGFPIQTSTDQGSFAPPRGFSQLITSFFGSQCQGIRPALFLVDRSCRPWFSLPGGRCVASHLRPFERLLLCLRTGLMPVLCLFLIRAAFRGTPRMSFHCLRFSLCGFQGANRIASVLYLNRAIL